MEKTQMRLREQIDSHRADRSRRNVRFPARLRQAIGLYADKRRAEGTGVHALARSLALSPNTLYEWLGQRRAGAAFDPCGSSARERRARDLETETNHPVECKEVLDLISELYPVERLMPP